MYQFTKTCLIKVANTAPSDNNKASEIVIERAKPGKVTAVVMGMSIFSKKRCNSRSANLGNEKPSFQKVESADFSEENSRGPKDLSQKMRKGQLPKKIASKLKTLELNSTILKLKSKKTHSDCTKKPDPSVSYGLKSKIRQLGFCLTTGQVVTSFP